ncbi:hypothetical protein NNJEOMEG_01259 [Fundidesulfovibrio magnetotacticus]|uniref:MlaB-like STAS domain-containing protein n=1 Tax=Fundidesulfovibrio magnetotacticus TaxID=2730080 RepID=A0A6V8LUU0_9BACT|nr:STAS domain-containing protein [Fundidesulfovibrio magnetotacticus]GFK93427.1 hypothetical protein NNJEOMEG_01259 [Fundidesulfovibrio magnetotacticus]
MNITLAGDCSVSRAEEIHAAFLEALRSGAPLELDLAGVTNLDLTFCQLLHALRAGCEAKGSTCTLLGQLQGAAAGQALLCGFPELAATAQDAPESKERAE